MPRSLRIRFLRNVVEYKGIEAIFSKHRKFSDATNSTMHWVHTPEGHDFWQTISSKGIKAAYNKSEYKVYFKTTTKSF
jgi:hypothetical protein